MFWNSYFGTVPYLNLPSGVALDSTGNIYISDLYNQRIRKVSQTTGVITTVAGNGNAGSSGDGGPATSASFAYPQGLAVDSYGNIFISDYPGRVREVTSSTGKISTVAGTGSGGFNGDYIVAQSALVNNTWGLATDSSGNLFITDAANYRVRQVGLPSVVTVTAAPTTTSIVATPTASVYGQSVAFTATVATSNPVPVNGTVQFQVDGTNFGSPVTLSNGTATSISTSILAVGNHQVTAIFTAGTGFSNSSSGFAYNIPGNIISTVAGNGTALGLSGDNITATSASLWNPLSVAVDSAGNIYIAAPYDNRIREVVKATGNIITIAGTGTAGYSGNGGAATAATLNTPNGVALDNAGNIYIADRGNNVIRKITKATGIITTIAGSGTAGFFGDGGAATSAQINAPLSVAVDSLGNVYFADYNNNRIRKVNTSGIISTFAGTGTIGYNGDAIAATSANITNPYSVAVDSSGNVYIADFGADRIRKVSNSGIISTFAGTGTLGFSGDGGPANAALLNYPSGVATDNSGNVYIGDSSNQRIRKVIPSGIISTIAGTGVGGYNGDGIAATSARINFAIGMAIDGSGNVFLADQSNNRIREVIASSGLINHGRGQRIRYV